MKTFFKSIFMTLCLSLVILFACVFLQTNNVNSAYALDNNIIHTVNFYDIDNLLYSVDVLEGQSLSNYSNANIIKNSSFIENNGSQTLTSNYINFANYWYNVYSGDVSFNNGFSLDTTRYNGENFYIFQVVDIIPGNTYYCNLVINDKIFRGSVYIPSDYSTGFEYWLSDINDINNFGIRLRLINTSRGSFGNKWFFDIYYSKWNNPDNIMVYNTSKIYLGLQDYNYFNLDYINKVYSFFNNLNVNSNVLWSTSNSTGQFDFNTLVTEDINLYGYQEFVEYDGKNLFSHSAEASYSSSYYLLEKAIDNIEYIHYKCSLNFKITIDTSLLNVPYVQFFSLSTNKSLGSLVPNINSTSVTSQNVNSLVFNCVGFNNTEYYNFAFLGSEPCVEMKLINGLIPQYNFSLIQNSGLVEFIVSPNIVKLNFNNLVFTDYIENYIFYNGSDINDMNSKTNYFLPILSSSDNFYLPLKELADGSTAQFLFNYNLSDFNNSDKYINVIIETTEDNYSYYNIYLQNLYSMSGAVNTFALIFSGPDDPVTMIPFNAYYLYENNFGFNFTEFNIVIRKSVQRVDNSLVIFNFGYNNFLTSVTEFTYQLRRGNYYYNIVYSGLLENSKMIVIDNDFVRNSLFSEYIYLNFELDGSTTSTFDIVDGEIGTYLGFDFNFVYYTQPLIVGNSSYDLMGYKPEYLDGTPSLVPFNIPFTAWIYNAFLWLIFDCPLISDLIGLIHLNLYLGSMISLLNFYINSPIGEFVMACFTFIIFWAILKYLMPGVVGGLVKSSSDSYKEHEMLREETNKLNSRYKKISSFKGRKSRVKFAYKPNSSKRYKMRNMVYKTKSNKNKGFSQRSYSKKNLDKIIDNIDDIDEL